LRRASFAQDRPEKGQNVTSNLNVSPKKRGIDRAELAKAGGG
jgi:hypothetical protein